MVTDSCFANYRACNTHIALALIPTIATDNCFANYKLVTKVYCISIDSYNSYRQLLRQLQSLCQIVN